MSMDPPELRILRSEDGMSKKKKKPKDTEYAHNPRYCMILPDASKEHEKDISSTGQS